MDQVLSPRQYFGGYSGCNYGGNCDSTWYRWGRWVLLGCIIVAAILCFFLLSCLSARRRRKMGYAPYRGTAWALPGHGQAQYVGGNAQPQLETQQTPYYNNSNNPPPPPAYSPPSNTQTSYGANQSYYGNTQGIELQQPQAAYVGQYAPPKGPPPAK